MGMTKEIEEVFRRVLENDLARISRSAVPTYHWTTSAPCSMCHFSRPTSGNSISLRGQDYQIVTIELDPLEIQKDTRMATVRDRRAFRNQNDTEALTEFDNAVNAGDFDKAYHEYIEESRALGPIPIIPRYFDENVIDTELPSMITFSGIDYVSKDLLDSITDQAGYDTQIKSKLEPLNPGAHIDQWPEKVVLRHPDTLAKVTYVRFDVEFWEEGEKQNRRFG